MTSADLTSKIQELEKKLAAKESLIKTLLDKLNTRQNSDVAPFTVLEQNSALQDVVQRKTRQLEEKNLELQAAHDSLRQAQSELLQAQKLESVGRLAAGVAHEINTPIQFVNDSNHFLQDATADILRYVDLLREVRSESSHPRVQESIEMEEEIEYGYLNEQVPKALERSIDGLKRVAEIVRSMKEFAHPDSKELVYTDINRLVTTTLTIARSEFKYVAQAETDLGQIPEVLCLPGEISQVMLNLVVNAAHAIEDVVGNSGTLGLITIKTYREDGCVVIAINDTGTGIPEHVRETIFDPFFTTKEVGKGTGQGLAIAHRVVVQQHGGQLRFDSEVGKGTTFFIELPIETTGSAVA